MNVGIHSCGIAFPKQVRDNSWWPQPVVDTWMKRRRARPSQPSDYEEYTPSMRAAHLAIIETQKDPFMGVVSRFVVQPGQLASELEHVAAERAIAAAGADRAEIDLVMVNSNVPDDINAPNSCLMHESLGLNERCFTLSTSAACNAVMLQLTLAEKMIASGQTRKALLVQSTTPSPMIDPEMNLSPLFGDAASALVVGPVSDGRGLLGCSHRTDGDFYHVIKMNVPGGRWFDAERVLFYPDDAKAGHRMLLLAGEQAGQVVGEALDVAGIKPEDVGFYAAHQGTAWFQRVTRKAGRLTNADSVDTFSWTGNISAVSIPLCCKLATDEGRLEDGDVVAMFSGGSGITWSGMVLRWGR
jgi:3-oxoacyl-[acyl-carrier-protein] synthase-3